MRRLITALTLALLGCGGSSGPTTVPVAGTITLNGEPLAGAEIVFVTEDFSSFGKTGPDGSYALVQGAVPGENQVSISKWEGEGLELNPDEGHDEGQIEDEMLAMEGDASPVSTRRQLVPEDFRKLTYSVPEGGSETADFRLTGN